MKKKIQERPQKVFFLLKNTFDENFGKPEKISVCFDSIWISHFDISSNIDQKLKKKHFFKPGPSLVTTAQRSTAKLRDLGSNPARWHSHFFQGFIFFRELFSFCVLNRNSTHNWTTFRKEPRFLAVNYLNKIVYLTFLIIFIFPNILLKIGFIVLFRGKVSDPSPRGRVFIVQLGPRLFFSCYLFRLKPKSVPPCAKKNKL